MTPNDRGAEGPAEPLVLRVGNRSVSVDGSPLPVRDRSKGPLSLRGSWPSTVDQPDAASLVVRLSARGFGCLLLTVPLGAVGTLVFGLATFFPGLRPYLLPGVGEFLSGCLLLPLTCLFL